MAESADGCKEHRLKMVVVGALGTGKTSIIRRYVNDSFLPNYKATIGVDFALKVVNFDPKTRVFLQLWDVAGQERFGSMTKIYYKKAKGAMVVFDVADPKTFLTVENWVQDIRDKLRPREDIPIMLLANKYDRIKEKGPGPFVAAEKIEEIVKKLNLIGWMYVSAKDRYNIKESVQTLLEEVLKNTTKEEEEDCDAAITLGGTEKIPPPPQNDNFCGCIGGGD